MKAKELFETTKKNQLSIETIIEQCLNSAKNGQSSINVFAYLSTETISELGNMGFSVRKETGQMGEGIYLISWEQ